MVEEGACLVVKSTEKSSWRTEGNIHTASTHSEVVSFVAEWLQKYTTGNTEVSVGLMQNGTWRVSVISTTESDTPNEKEPKPSDSGPDASGDWSISSPRRLH